MRHCLVAAFVLIASGIVAAPSPALEKTLVPAPDDLDVSWGAANTTVRVHYYNVCNAWLWAVRSGSGEDDVYGVTFDRGCGQSQLLTQTRFLALAGGYGFTGTGTISILDGTDCAAPVVALQPFLPQSDSSLMWFVHTWNVPVGELFTVMLSVPSRNFYRDPALVMDVTWSVLGGLDPCGTCYPSPRLSHSKYFGVNGSICAGVPLPVPDPTGSGCDAELIMTADFKCATGVEERSWGRIKTLYR